MKRNVSVVCVLQFRCNILISGKIIKEMPGSVASGTPYIRIYRSFRDGRILLQYPTLPYLIQLPQPSKLHTLFLGYPEDVSGKSLRNIDSHLPINTM